MATSVVDILNNSLVRIGSKTITSLTDGDKVANACNTIYDRTKDSLLRQHLWNFALKRTELASEEDAPSFGYNYSYPLPADFVRVVRLTDSYAPYKIEGSKLLTDASRVQLVYVHRVEDVSKFDPLFTEALVLLLAINLSYTLIGSNGREASLKEELRSTLFLAKQIDGQDDTPDSFDAGSFLEAKMSASWDSTKVYGSWPI